jgi:hypothetical protein
MQGRHQRNPGKIEDAERELRRDVLLDVNHVRSAQAIPTPGSDRWSVAIRLGAEDAERLEKATEANIGKRLAIFVGGKCIMAPTIQEAIRGDTLVISGRFSREEAEALAAAMQPQEEGPGSASDGSGVRSADAEPPTRVSLEEAVGLLKDAHAEMGRRDAQGAHYLAMAVRPGDPRTGQSARFWVFSYAPGDRPKMVVPPRSLPGVYFATHFMSVNGHYPSEYVDEKGDVVPMPTEGGKQLIPDDPLLIAWGSTTVECELTDEQGNSMRFMLSPQPAPRANGVE